MQRLFDKLLVSCSPFRAPTRMDALHDLQPTKLAAPASTHEHAHGHEHGGDANADDCGEDCDHDHSVEGSHAHEHGHEHVPAVGKTPPPRDIDDEHFELPDPPTPAPAEAEHIAAPDDAMSTPAVECGSHEEVAAASEAPWRKAVLEAPVDLD